MAMPPPANRVVPAVWVNPRVKFSVPLSAETVPVLLKPTSTVVVPVPALLRKVPELTTCAALRSSRSMVRSVNTSNVPLFARIALLRRRMLPLEVPDHHEALPALVRVRPSRVTFTP